MDAVAEQLSKSRTLIARWSAKHGWVERARDWDELLGAKQLADPQAIDDIRKFRDRATETSVQMQMLGAVFINGALVQLKRFLEKSDAGGAPETMEARDAIALGRFGVSLKQVGLEAEAQAIGAAEIDL